MKPSHQYALLLCRDKTPLPIISMWFLQSCSLIFEGRRNSTILKSLQCYHDQCPFVMDIICTNESSRNYESFLCLS